MKAIDLVGKRFGRWTVIERAVRPLTSSPSKPIYWKCKCKCGNESIVPAHNLRCHLSTSCGCSRASDCPPFELLYKFFLSSNQKRGVSCQLSFEDFLSFVKVDNCHYCHRKIEWFPRRSKKPNTYNLDRMDNSVGYLKENCVVCCGRCNFGKSNRFTYEEWYGMTGYFRNRH